MRHACFARSVSADCPQTGYMRYYLGGSTLFREGGAAFILSTITGGEGFEFPTDEPNDLPLNTAKTAQAYISPFS